MSAPTATALPPAVARGLLVVSLDLQEAGDNIAALAEEIHGDGSNRAYVIRRIHAEMRWIYELLEELEDAP